MIFIENQKKTDFFLSKPDYFYQYDLILFIQNFDDQSYQFSKLSVILGNTVLTKKWLSQLIIDGCNITKGNIDLLRCKSNLMAVERSNNSGYDGEIL